MHPFIRTKNSGILSVLALTTSLKSIGEFEKTVYQNVSHVFSLITILT